MLKNPNKTRRDTIRQVQAALDEASGKQFVVTIHSYEDGQLTHHVTVTRKFPTADLELVETAVLAHLASEHASRVVAKR